MARPLTKKSEVIDAALALFMRKGIKATTTRDIALRAGISEGTIYRHFESKEELAEILFDENLNYFWKFLKGYLSAKRIGIRENTRNPEEMLRAYIEGFFEFSRREQRRYSFIIAAHQTELKKQSRERMKPKQMLTKILRLGQMQGIFRKVDIQLAGAMVMGTIIQTIFYLKSGGIAVNYDEVVSEVAETCLRMVKNEKSEFQKHT
jgi:AcrR family transcriptional regulator